MCSLCANASNSHENACLSPLNGSVYDKFCKRCTVTHTLTRHFAMHLSSVVVVAADVPMIGQRFVCITQRVNYLILLLFLYLYVYLVVSFCGKSGI